MLSPFQFSPSAQQGHGCVNKLCGASAPTGINHNNMLFVTQESCFIYVSSQTFGVKPKSFTKTSPLLIWDTASANFVENDTMPTKNNKNFKASENIQFMRKEFFLPLN